MSSLNYTFQILYTEYSFHSRTLATIFFIASRRELNSQMNPPGLTSRQSQSHIATDGQSVSQSVSQCWCRAQSETHDQIFINV
jgi:hypothetical protein